MGSKRRFSELGWTRMRFRELKELIRTGNAIQVAEVLDATPDLVNARDLAAEHWEERTALHCAARYAKLDIVRLLVERGAEVYSHPGNSYPPVFVAAQYAYHSDRPNAQNVVDYFLKEIPQKAEGTLGTGATIHIAARSGFVEVVRKHLSLDPLAVHQRGWLGDTPLHWACHNGHLEIVGMLLDAGADIEADEINCYGGKPLHWASEHAPAVVKLLLERGAQVDALNINRDSQLFGVTPLLMNAYQKDDCWQVAELLLAAGANPERRHRGKTALEIAREAGNAKIAAVLESHAAGGISVANRKARTAVRVRRIRRPPAPPPRPAEAHKGTFGSVLIVAGSDGMAGAASLAGQAALHGGAGLVTIACPKSVAKVVAGGHSSYMTIPLPDDGERITESAITALQVALTNKTAMALGPGLGQSESLQRLVHRLYDTCDIPLVLDADGINAFVGHLERVGTRQTRAARIWTPHPGEFARLVQMETRQVQAKREDLAIHFARENHVVLLLKGANTIVTDGERIAVNTTGCNALATGGSGDVLTGLIVALLAQGMPAFEAAQFGAYLHGLAGESAAEQFGERFTSSVEVLAGLGPAWRTVLAMTRSN